ncbi:MAG: hypothetical protein DHS20C05_06910 [Hyphococcus sp.]|nr:MAG: hypothetical protein DHS20C05_06910 [Marinicaulis sp.]
MALSAIKTAFLVMLATIIGAGQVCACAPTLNSSHENMATTDHAIHDEMDHSASHDVGEYHLEHDTSCEEGCAHCNQSSLSKSVNASGAATIPLPPAPEKLAIYADGVMFWKDSGVFKNARSLGWLDPPPITPVTLKIRLLN